MRYIALDTETTGLDPSTCQLLQLAMVLADSHDSETPLSNLPTFYASLNRDVLVGELVAITMNLDLLDHMLSVRKELPATGCHMTEYRGRQMPVYAHIDNLDLDAASWLDKHAIENGMPIVLAGCNPAFDRSFLPPMLKRRFHYRMLDVASMAMGRHRFLWDGTKLPGQADLTPRPVHHDALEDARNVVAIVRSHMPHAEERV